MTVVTSTTSSTDSINSACSGSSGTPAFVSAPTIAAKITLHVAHARSPAPSSPWVESVSSTSGSAIVHDTTMRQLVLVGGGASHVLPYVDEESQSKHTFEFMFCAPANTTYAVSCPTPLSLELRQGSNNKSDLPSVSDEEVLDVARFDLMDVLGHSCGINISTNEGATLTVCAVASYISDPYLAAEALFHARGGVVAFSCVASKPHTRASSSGFSPVGVGAGVNVDSPGRVYTAPGGATIHERLCAWTWSVARMGVSEGDGDADSDEEEMIDVGDGVMAPKRNVARLRSNFDGACGIPAASGKDSLLKCIQFRVGGVSAARPRTIPLGKPLSFSKGCVIHVAKYMRAYNEHMFVDEVELSSEEEDDDDEDSEREEEEEICLESESDRASSISEATSFSYSARSNSPKKRAGSVESSGAARSESDARIDFESTRMAALIERVTNAENERAALRRELADTAQQRDTLRAAMDTAALSARIAELEAALCTERENWERERISAAQRLDVERDARRRAEARLREAQAENVRLLSTIGRLAGELDREPGRHEVVDQLVRAKSELVQERVDKEELLHTIKTWRNNAKRALSDRRRSAAAAAASAGTKGRREMLWPNGA